MRGREPAEADAGEGAGGSLVMVGEVRTGLVLNSQILRTASVEALLDLVPGQRVRSHQRPVQRSVSADLLHGVDCSLLTGSGARMRGIGTLAARARVVGGRVLQSSTRAVLSKGGEQRLAWAHYLERPGVIEVTGRGREGDLPTRFLAGSEPGALDPGAVSEWLTGRIQSSALLDHRPAFRSRRSRLRWSVLLDADAFEGAFTLVDDELRTLRLSVPAQLRSEPEQFTTLCEDLALHDWLLGTVASVAGRACTGSGDAAALRRLRPAIDHLVHLWMPGAAVASELTDAWDRLESRAGLTRQWDACVNRIRDHMALRALEMMAASSQGPA
jgi:hypothetical protein